VGLWAHQSQPQEPGDGAAPHEQGLTAKTMALDDLFADTDLGDAGGAEEF
jgi:hypothetical protein